MLSRTLATLLYKEKIHVHGVLAYLSQHNLTSLVRPVLLHMQKLKRIEDERNTLRIESPFPLERTSVKAITHLVGEEVHAVTETLKPELLAGFVARYKGKEYDASAQRIITNFIRES